MPKVAKAKKLTKFCKECEEDLPSDNFVYGRRVCKACQKTQRRDYYVAHIDKWKDYNKKGDTKDIVYKIIDKRNGKAMYVGSTRIALRKRWLGHLNLLNNKEHNRYNSKLYKGLRSVKEENLDCVPIKEFKKDILSKEELLAIENFYAESLKSPLNTNKPSGLYCKA